ncbi:hypothetical protein [Sediminispirochaeta bajacaliforniensis]|uniref:hypothetical protein n=1 Tax=Sediminispirochaeta bajacaliforniensis TaxID=148 RepID=UPI0003765C72|nr:hypothetical protein [Sediminispirochaeta bajacaliforniensis]
MNLYELYDVTTWIKYEVVEKKVPSLYQELINVIEHNINAQNDQPQQPFDKQRNALIEGLKKIKIFSLSFEQIELLKNIGCYESIGKNAANEIDQIFYKKGLDIASALKEIQTLHQRLNSGIDRLKKIETNLNGIIKEKDRPDIDNEAVLKVHFKQHASITNVSEFKKWANDWYDISRGIALSIDMAPESVRVISAEKGSIIVALSVAIPLAGIVSKVILRVLEIADKVLEIKKKSEEIKNLKLQNKKIEQDLIKEAETIKKNEIEQLVIQIVEEHIVQPDGEKRTALEKSIKKLISFIEKGGDVDCYIPYDSENASDTADEREDNAYQIYTNFKKIRELDSKLKLLAYVESETI